MGLISRVSSRTYRDSVWRRTWLAAENQLTKIVFIVGGPGCGKGTQCAKIVEKYGYCHLSSGDLLRAEVATGTPRAAKLKDTMTKGELVDDELVLALMKEKIDDTEDARGFLIDGYPRTVGQGKLFESKIQKCTAVIYIEADEDAMVARLMERGKTSGRADDNPETIKQRLRVFSEQTKPVVDHFSAKLTKVNGLQTIDEVFAGVDAVMQKL